MTQFPRSWPTKLWSQNTRSAGSPPRSDSPSSRATGAFRFWFLTRRAPDPSELEDVAYGREVARKIAGLDIGQTVVVADRACVAVEAMEGTDSTIERAASLSNGRRLVVVKVSKPGQDMRFDVPVVGLQTIRVMSRSNARVLALDAGKTLLFDRTGLLEQANKLGIAI